MEEKESKRVKKLREKYGDKTVERILDNDENARLCDCHVTTLVMIDITINNASKDLANGKTKH